MFHMQVKNTCMWIKMPKWKLEEKNPNFQICYKGTQKIPCYINEMIILCINFEDSKK